MKMGGIKILLDTNIISSLMASDDFLAQKVDSVDSVYISSVSLGELYFGAHNSSKVDQYLSAISSVKDTYQALSMDEQTAFIYGRIKSDLKKKGRPIPENDIWIAAIAVQHNLVLISRDQHFSEIATLSWEIW
jgi:tRNA(fMet)-specific endonuclease VapC